MMLQARAFSLVVVILALASPAFGAAPPANAAAAIVNGEPIPLAEVDSIIQERLANDPSRPAPVSSPTPAQQRQWRLEVVGYMIDEALIRQYMRDHGSHVDASEVNKQFAALLAGLKAQNKKLSEFLREQHQTEAQVRANMTIQLQLDRYVKERTNEADMRKYYEANKDYFDKNMVRTSHIVIRVASNAPPAERAAAKQKLQAARADILAGRLSFAKAAQDVSQSPSAGKGGDIGFIYRKFQDVEEAYARVAFSMKVGEISDVVETEFGCHLILVTDRKEGTPTKYEQSLDVVRDCYAEDLRITLVNQLRRQAKVQILVP